MTDDYEYFKNKRTDRVYLSRSLEQKSLRKTEGEGLQEFVRPFRIVSKVIEPIEAHQFFKDGKEVSLRVTSGERQEIKAKFYEDTRDVFALQIQKYTKTTGIPHNSYFTFVGEEIAVLYNFLRNIAVLPINGEGSAKIDDRFLQELILTREQAVALLANQPELLDELLRHNVTAEDVAELGRRRNQLERFRSLLTDDEYFESARRRLGVNKRPEDVWQDFFELNTWIFGYGLNYYFNSPLDGKKLEQVIRGYDAFQSGKRVDALLKTQGIVSALSFGEIKTHKTPLLKDVKNAYRTESWQISDEVAGGIAQVQRTVQVSLRSIKERTNVVDKEGEPTGEQIFLFQPRSFLVVGSLAEFQVESGVNESKYSSFELLRRSLSNPEIVTFDELYERARFIVESGQVPTEGGG